jgi:hypothetical protein
MWHKIKIVWFLCFLTGSALVFAGGPPLRLHVQASKIQLLGDGDEQATLTITARDEKGEIRPDIHGKIVLKASSGQLSSYEPMMRDGIAEVVFTAPILNNEGKGFQRGIEMTMKILEEAVKSFQGQNVTKKEVKKKIGEMVDQAPGMATMQSISGKDPFVYIVARKGDIAGKTRIKIEQDEVAGSRLGGVYQGTPIATDETWTMVLRPSGHTFEAEITSDSNSEVMCLTGLGEKKAGMSVVYIFSKKDLERTRRSGNKDFHGMPTAMKILPGNALYLVAPPVLFKKISGLKQPASQEDTETNGDKVFTSSLIAKTNMLLADGKSQTQVVFHCVDKKNRPRRNVSVSFSMSRSGLGGRILKAEKKTDAHGLARMVYRAPEMKAHNLQELGTCKNEWIQASYQNAKGKGEIAGTQIGCLKCAEGLIHFNKEGFENDYNIPVVFGSPWGEMTGQLKARFRPPDLTGWEVQPVADADVTVECEALEPILDTLTTATDLEGKFKIELKMHNWPYYWRMPVENMPLISFHKGTEHRANVFTEKLYLFQDKQFEREIYSFIYLTHKKLCRLDRKQIVGVNQKLHLFGLSTEVFLSTRKLLEDTGGEITGHGWAVLKGVFSVVNQKYKLTKGIEDRLKKLSYKFEDYVGLRDLTVDKHRSFKSMIYRKLKSFFGNSEFLSKWNKSFGKNISVRPFMRWMDDFFGSVSKELQGFISSVAASLAKQFNLGQFPKNPIPELIMNPLINQYARDVKVHFKTLIHTPDEDIQALFERKRARLIVKSSDLGAHYLSISAWRLTAEETKAWVDLATEVATNGMTVYAIFTGNIKAVEVAKKLKDLKSKLDLLASSCGMFLEIYNFCQLKTECMEILKMPRTPAGSQITYLNRSPAPKQNAVECFFPFTGFNWSSVLPAEAEAILFQWSAELPEEDASDSHEDPPSFQDIDFKALESRNGQLSPSAVGPFIKQVFRWESWQGHLDPGSFQLMAEKPELAVEFMEKNNELSESLDRCLMMASLFEAQDHFLQLREGEEALWNDEIHRIRTLSADLEKDAVKVLDAVESLQGHTSSTGLLQSLSVKGSLKWLVLSGAVCLILLLAVVLILVFKKSSGSSPRGPFLRIGRTDFPLIHPTTHIGSAPGNQIQLHKGVAEFHAKVCRSNQHTYWIEVLSPDLWIAVNHKKGPSFWLKQGVKIQIGGHTLRFYLK